VFFPESRMIMTTRYTSKDQNDLKRKY